jgi:hypothetical protein
MAQDAARAVKEQAKEVWTDAKEAARSRVGEGQQAAAKGLGDFAGALRQAAHGVDESPVPVARLADTVADGLERLSGTLRSKDLNSLLRDTESFARRQPVGFLAVRFLRSSAASQSSGGTDIGRSVGATSSVGTASNVGTASSASTRTGAQDPYRTRELTERSREPSDPSGASNAMPAATDDAARPSKSTV